MDWIAALLNVIGVYLLAKYRKAGVVVFCFSSVAFLIWAAANEVWSIVVLQVILLTLNIRVIITWRNE